MRISSRTIWTRFAGAIATSVALSICLPSGAQAGSGATALASVALGFCGLIAGDTTPEAVQHHLDLLDKASQRLERDAPEASNRLAQAQFDADAMKKTIIRLRLAGQSDSNEAHDAITQYTQLLISLVQLQRAVDNQANLLTAITFTGPIVKACADARIAKLKGNLPPVTSPNRQVPTWPPAQTPSGGGSNPPVYNPPQTPAMPPPQSGPAVSSVCDLQGAAQEGQNYGDALKAKFPKPWSDDDAKWISANVSPLESDAHYAMATFRDYDKACVIYRQLITLLNGHVRPPPSTACRDNNDLSRELDAYNHIDNEKFPRGMYGADDIWNKTVRLPLLSDASSAALANEYARACVDYQRLTVLTANYVAVDPQTLQH